MINVYDETSAPMRRPRSPRWWPRVVDVFIVVALLALNVVSVGPAEDAAIPARTLVLTSLIVLPLLVRRRWPVPSAAVIFALVVVQLSLQITARPGDIAVLVAVYTLTVYRGGRLSDVAGALSVVILLITWAQDPKATSWTDLIAPMVVVVAIFYTGRAIRVRRVYLQGLEDRALRAESERDALARAAVAEERGRIAREMHDVVAHRVGVIVAQADGAMYAFDAHPEQARAALDVIAASGRSALTELRQLLGVLRGTEESGTAPQPGLTDIDALVVEMRAAGLPVRLTSDGAAPPVQASVGLTVYRVVQECLTNTLKHAGAGTPVEVALSHTPTSVHVRISDEGTREPSTGSPVGHGLIGMRERVTMLGGTFAAAPARPHGWLVDVTIPVGAGE
jgi:signal transduction histidine kinase